MLLLSYRGLAAQESKFTVDGERPQRVRYEQRISSRQRDRLRPGFGRCQHSDPGQHDQYAETGGECRRSGYIDRDARKYSAEESASV